MKRPAHALALALALALSACSQQSAEEKIKAKIAESTYYLTAEEKMLAEANAKQFFNKQWPQKQQDGSMGQAMGYLSDCRNSDSNFNGLVTCAGKTPVLTGGYVDTVRYCGYRKEIVGCNDQDTK